MRLDDENRIVIDGIKTFKLTKREYTLFKYLFNCKDRVVPESELVDAVWNKLVKSNVVMTTISRIRKKLGYDCIETRYGLGYKYVSL